MRDLLIKEWEAKITFQEHRIMASGSYDNSGLWDIVNEKSGI